MTTTHITIVLEADDLDPFESPGLTSSEALARIKAEVDRWDRGVTVFGVSGLAVA